VFSKAQISEQSITMRDGRLINCQMLSLLSFELSVAACLVITETVDCFTPERPVTATFFSPNVMCHQWNIV